MAVRTKSMMERLVMLIVLIYFAIVNVIIVNADEGFMKDIKELKNALENYFGDDVKYKNMSTKIQNKDMESGLVFQMESRKLIFVKHDSGNKSKSKYLGEFEGLETLRNASRVFVPRPILIGHTVNPSHNFIVMDYLKMNPLDTNFFDLGNRIADLHMINIHKVNRNISSQIKRFGFHVDTSNGNILQNNTWTDDWITFFMENRIGYQIELLRSKMTDDPDKKEILENCWPQLKPIIPNFFKNIKVLPSLLHGDLKPRNIAKWDGKPVIFDPATFYGHYEYDIASSTLFGGLNKEFYIAYFRKIKKCYGYKNRLPLYNLFHYLNIWQEHGGDFLKLAVKTCKTLLKLDL